MDVPAGNSLPNPYSDNAATNGQPTFPWRGHITCSPAPGYAGTVDKTAAAAAQVDVFFGTAAPSDFGAWNGDTISYSGPAEWSYRRMILHYAKLAVAAGGVDAFLIGSEMVALNAVRSSASAFPAVSKMVSLAADVKGIVGSGCKVGYAADWSEYANFRPDDGSNDLYFHLDPLWASASIDFVGVDNYMPLSDWRSGRLHLDAQAGAPPSSGPKLSDETTSALPRPTPETSQLHGVFVFAANSIFGLISQLPQRRSVPCQAMTSETVSTFGALDCSWSSETRKSALPMLPWRFSAMVWPKPSSR
jgi:hypothetical protein